MRRAAQSLASLASAAALLAAVACTDEPAADEELVSDDMASGDSLPDGKADGYTVPGSLGLDKNGVLYLTFDDGPSPALTPKILDTLARHQVKAVFFVTGPSIASNLAILRRARDEGHIIANHQWKHAIASTETDFRSWVTRNREAIEGAVGEMPLYFRYPYGAAATWRENILKELGYTDGGIGWDIDSLDWDFGSDGKSTRPEVPAQYRNDFEGWILMQAERRGGGVLLFHDVQSITASRLDSVLTRLEGAGFRFGEFPRDRTGATEPPGDAFIGDPCTRDEDCGFAGGFCLTGPDWPGGYCTRPCTSSCPDRDGYATTRCVRAPDENGASIDVCAVTCGDGCREGLECSTYLSPGGTERDVCW